MCVCGGVRSVLAYSCVFGSVYLIYAKIRRIVITEKTEPSGCPIDPILPPTASPAHLSQL